MVSKVDGAAQWNTFNIYRGNVREGVYAFVGSFPQIPTSELSIYTSFTNFSPQGEQILALDWAHEPCSHASPGEFLCEQAERGTHSTLT